MTPQQSSSSSSNSRYSLRNRNSDGQVDAQNPLPPSSPSAHVVISKKKPAKKLAAAPKTHNDDAELPEEVSELSEAASKPAKKKSEPQPITGKRKRRGAFSSLDGNVRLVPLSEVLLFPAFP